MPPTICFVPGFWLGPKPYLRVASLLQSQGFPTQILSLSSTGSVSPGNPSMVDDIDAIRSKVSDLVSDGKEVVMVLHSAGGFLGSNAIEGLTVQARKEKGLEGGVSQIIFVAGAVFPEGFQHAPLPFFKIEGGAMYCQEPEDFLYNDLKTDDAKRWVDILNSQPATGWDDTVTYCAWRQVSSVYLVCEKDKCISPSWQLQLAETAGSRLEKCDGGHCPMVSMPEEVAEIVKKAVEFAV